jgi:hypothetical protein
MHFDVVVPRPATSSQHTSPVAQLLDPEQVSVLPRQVAAPAAPVATHVRVARQHTSVFESQVLVPHAI